MTETNGLLTAILAAMREQPVRGPVQFERLAGEACPVDSCPLSTEGNQTVYTRDLIVEAGQRYTRNGHPKLFRCVDLLDRRGDVGGMSYRAIARLFQAETGGTISPTWAGVAKNYWLARRRV